MKKPRPASKRHVRAIDDKQPTLTRPQLAEVTGGNSAYTDDGTTL